MQQNQKQPRDRGGALVKLSVDIYIASNQPIELIISGSCGDNIFSFLGLQWIYAHSTISIHFCSQSPSNFSVDHLSFHQSSTFALTLLQISQWITSHFNHHAPLFLSLSFKFLSGSLPNSPIIIHFCSPSPSNFSVDHLSFHPSSSTFPLSYCIVYFPLSNSHLLPI